MTYHTLYLEVQYRSEIIERVLRVVRHRGFMLHTLHVLPCGNLITDKCKLHVYMTLISQRSISVLYEHLNKLIDVSYISIQSSN